MNKKKIILLVLLSSFTIALAIFLIKYDSIFGITHKYEGNAKINTLFLFCFVAIIISSFLTFKVLFEIIKNKDKNVRFIFVGIFLIFVFVNSQQNDKLEGKRYVNKYGGVVKVCTIQNKRANQVHTARFDVEYLHNGTLYKSTLGCKMKDFRRLKEGDAILILHSLDFPKISMIFDLYPSIGMKEKFKIGLFYKDGQVIDSLIVE